MSQERDDILKGVRRTVIKTLLWITLAVFIVLGSVAVVVQIPYFQTRIVQKLSQVFSGATGFFTTVDHVSIKWFDTIVLEEIFVLDKENKTMIRVETLDVDFDLRTLLRKSNIYIDEVRLLGGEVNLKRDTVSGMLNVDQFIRALGTLAKKNASSPITIKQKTQPPSFNIADVLIRDFSFSLSKVGEPFLKERFDHNHFRLTDINGEIESLRTAADTFEISVNQLSCIDSATQFKVSEFQTFFRYSRTGMWFQNLRAHAGKSIIKDSLVFTYDEPADLGHFLDSVNIEANIHESVVYAKDLGVFAPYFRQFDDYYTVGGKFDGIVRHFTVDDFLLDFGNSSHFSGRLSFDGLPEVKETFIDVKLKNSQIGTHDFKPYLPAETYETAQKFGNIRFSALFIGFFNDFVANGSFDTGLGKITSDINLKVAEPSRYSGKLAAADFDIGTLANDTSLLQKVDFAGSIDGSGFTIEDADFNLKARFNYLDFNRYRYQNITTNARFAKSFFQGALGINDPNLQFDANGTVDLRGGKQDIVIDAKLDTAFLKPIQLSDDDAFVSTTVQADIKGLALDSIVGEAQFKNFFVEYQGRDLTIDSLSFVSERKSESRKFQVKSTQLNAILEGNYEFTNLYTDISDLIKEYKLIFINDKEDLDRFYRERTQRIEADSLGEEKYKLAYDITFSDVNPLLNLFAPDVYVSPHTQLIGNFTSGYTSIFSLSSSIDTLVYKDYHFYRNTIDIATSKIADSANVLAMAYLYSEEQYQQNEYGEQKIELQDLNFNLIWDEDHIDFSQSIAQQNTDNYINVEGEVTFLTDSTEIRFEPSDFKAIGKHWHFSKDNKIIISNNELTVHNFVIYNEDSVTKKQEISAHGRLSHNPEDKLTMEVKNFLVDNINPLTTARGREYHGQVDGYVELSRPLITQDSADYRLILTSSLSITAFAVNDFPVGDITGLAEWSNDRNELDVNFNVIRNSDKVISVFGNYQPRELENQLDLKANFKDANINVLEPYLSSIFSEIKGKANGEFFISGMLDHPILNGDGIIKDGHIKVNYLNTQYDFIGNLFFDENTIGFSDMVLTDDKGEEAVMNGGIFHDGFKDFVVDLTGEFDNFTVMNTSAIDNDLYYGKAVGTGSVNFLGAFSHLNITAKGTTNRGTRIFIPLEETSDIEQSDFIRFVSAAEEKELEEEEEKVQLTGLNLDLELDITPEAYFEMIFDIKTGDIIRGRGDGQIKLEVDTDGEFSMFGDYQFREGGYNFTLYNIVNKEFSIQPGSTISWYGDPYGGIMDVQAIYKQMASLAPLVNVEESRQSTEIKRRYPTEVILDLQGELLSPEIDFDIVIEDYPENNPELNFAVTNFNNTISVDEQELNRQVFSLLILRRFSDRNSFDGTNAVGSSVSELISNQFSYWLSQVDENLEINIDLGSLDEDEFSTFQLRLSYTFLDGRLRVTRDGGFTDVNNAASTASVIGDVTVEYLLSEDGKLWVKLYNRNNFNSFSSNVSNSFSTTQGFSLLHVESFDTIKELFSKARKKALEQKNEEKPEEGTPSSEEKPVAREASYPPASSEEKPRK